MQAESLWKFLDEMAESDPEAYGKFLQAQAEAAREETQSNKGEEGGKGGTAPGKDAAARGKVAGGGGGQLSFHHLVQGTVPVVVLDMPLGLSGKAAAKGDPTPPTGGLPAGSRAVIQVWRASKGKGWVHYLCNAPVDEAAGMWPCPTFIW